MQDKKKGILYILGAAFGFSLMSLFVRLSGDVPTYEKVVFRNAVAAVFSFFLLLREGKGFYVEKKNIPFLLIRTVSGAVGMVLNFYAIDHMNIADSNMLNKLSPVFAMLASIIILGERVNVMEWLAIVVSFIGALFVVKPGFHSEFLVALMATGGGLFAGLAYVFVRKLGQRGVRGNIIVFFFSFFSTIFVLPMAILHYQPLSMMQFLLLFAAGVGATIGQVCITRAYRYAPAKEIGVYDYMQVVYSAILGFLFLGQLPDIWSFVGYVMIIGMAILKWKYNLREEGIQKNGN